MFLVSFQLLEVHKFLWAASHLAEAGHTGILNKKHPHVFIADITKVPMNCGGGTYEIEIWIRTRLFFRKQHR